MKRRGFAIFLIVLTLLVISLAGASFAWFKHIQSFNTVSLIQIPSKITIAGPKRSELQRISLELTSDDTQNDGQVILKRVFCIESTADYKLEIAHTTNIGNMGIKIYPVKKENCNKESYEAGAVKGVAGAKSLYYIPETHEIAGGYLNQNTENKLAIQKKENGSLHDKTYSEGDAVQKNAEPLYWITELIINEANDFSSSGTASDGVTQINYRYFVLELSFDAINQETDVVYLIASHVE